MVAVVVVAVVAVVVVVVVVEVVVVVPCYIAPPCFKIFVTGRLSCPHSIFPGSQEKRKATIQLAGKARKKLKGKQLGRSTVRWDVRCCLAIAI